MKCETQSTASSFFEVICQQIEVEVYSLTLEAAYIGKTKEALDSTDLNIDLNLSGAFWYEVKSKAVKNTSSSSSSSSKVSVFTIMLAAQREQCHMERKRCCK